MLDVVQSLKRITPDLGRRQLGPIGLHLAQEKLHAVQLDGSGSSDPGLHAWQSTPYMGPRDEVMADRQRFRTLIRQTLKHGRFSGRKVVTSMPPELVRMTPLTYQARPGQDGEAILKLISERLDGPLGEFVVDYIPIRSDSPREEKQALVTSCRKTDVVAYLELLRRAGLDVAALEIGPVALRRLVAAMSRRDEARNVLVINFGTETTYLTIISQRRLLLDQAISFGEARLVARVASQLDLPLEHARALIANQGVESEHVDLETFDVSLNAVVGNPILDILKPEFAQLIYEVDRTYLYTASETRGGPMDKVYFFGSIARWPGTAELISTMVNMPAETLPGPTSLFPDHTKTKTDPEDRRGPELAVATGLALRGVLDDE